MPLTPANAPQLARELYDRLEAIHLTDAQSGYPMLAWCVAMTHPLEEIDEAVRDTPDGTGYSQVLDPQRCPERLLPWCAQYHGVTVPAGLTTQQTRDFIQAVPHWRRGSPDALTAAGRALLPNAVVTLHERTDANGLHERSELLIVAINTPETPAAEIEFHRYFALPHLTGRKINTRVDRGWSYGQAEAEHDGLTYGDVEALYAQYDDIETIIPEA